MKLSDFLFNVGRPVAFYPGLVKALGSMKQAVFICQMAYWKDKGSDPDGWIYKTAEEIEGETSLTYKEQITVRAALVEKKVLQERYARTEHQMYFRVDWDAVNTIWDEHLTNGHMPKGQVASYQRSGGILPKGSSLNGNSDTTPENTLIKPALDLFVGCFGRFKNQKELKRWTTLSEAVGWERSEELTEWALKKEIHLTNRAGLLDSLETAAKNWREKARSNGHGKTKPRTEYQPVELSEEQQAALRRQAQEAFGGVR